jgi:hypothetical protein
MSAPPTQESLQTQAEGDDFTGLTAEQRARLDKIRSEICNEKLMVSFSIEGRDLNGVRKSAFYSLTASRQHDQGAESAGWDVSEAKVVHALLSQQVVAAVYGDAARRGILLPHSAEEEVRRVLGAYDKQIARLLGNGGGGKR